MRKLLPLAFVVGLAGCASSAASLDAQTAAAADAVNAAATAALNAHNAGLIKSGTPTENDITLSLNAARAALDNADKALAAGNTSQVSLYLGEVAAAINSINVDLAGAK